METRSMKRLNKSEYDQSSQDEAEQQLSEEDAQIG